jgi:large subunit ribosomal protein L11e
MDFYACLGRKGLRVSRRKARRCAVGNFQKVTKNEAQKWFSEKLSGILV